MGQQTFVDVIWQILIFSAFKYLCVKFLELLDELLRFVFIKYYIYKSLKKKMSANMYWTCTIKLWKDINKPQCLCVILQ